MKEARYKFYKCSECSDDNPCYSIARYLENNIGSCLIYRCDECYDHRVDNKSPWKEVDNVEEINKVIKGLTIIANRKGDK